MNDVPAILHHDADLVVGYLPHVGVAAVVLLATIVVAYVTGLVAAWVLARLGLDALGERTGVSDDLALVGIRLAPARIVGRLIVFIVLLTGLVQAADSLLLGPLADTLRGLLTFMPHLVLAALVVLVGISIADSLAHNASGALSRAGVLYHGTARVLIRATIVVLAVLVALQQLTLASGFLLDVLLVLLGALALALGVALGWGGRVFFENLIAGHYVERHLRVGDTVRLAGGAGVVEALEPTSATLRTVEGRHVVIPNAVLARAGFERERPAEM